MATKSHGAPPARFSLFGLGLSAKNPKLRQRDARDEDDWYIPYNGPYEIPHDPPRPRDRDSWDHLLLDAPDAFGDTDLLDR